MWGGGTLVCESIKEGTVVGGNPVQEIGSFADFVDKRRCTKTEGGKACLVQKEDQIINQIKDMC